MNNDNGGIIFPSKFVELDSLVFKDTCISRCENLTVYQRSLVKESYDFISRKLLFEMIDKLSDCSNRIISYIGAFLKFNSNIIEFSKTDFSNFHKCSKVTFINAIEELEYYNIIERYSGRYSLYGVNYKYLFYGRTIDFINKYKIEFGDEKPIFDDKNRIVLSEDLYEQYKLNKKINNLKIK